MPRARARSAHAAAINPTRFSTRVHANEPGFLIANKSHDHRSTICGTHTNHHDVLCKMRPNVHCDSRHCRNPARSGIAHSTQQHHGHIKVSEYHKATARACVTQCVCVPNTRCNFGTYDSRSIELESHVHQRCRCTSSAEDDELMSTDRMILPNQTLSRIQNGTHGSAPSICSPQKAKRMPPRPVLIDKLRHTRGPW